MDGSIFYSGSVLRSVCKQVRAEAKHLHQILLCIWSFDDDDEDVSDVLSPWDLGNTTTYHTTEMHLDFLYEICDEIDSARYEDIAGP